MSNPIDKFHPAVARWFQDAFGTATEPQLRGWPRIQSGEHTLISAPTGSGKTLAAFLASLDRLIREGLEKALPDETRVLYISPLKALSNDIQKNLQEPLAGIEGTLVQLGFPKVPLRCEVRTGDTPAAQRQQLIKRPPHLLVTTPESFYLLLTSVSGQKILRTVDTVIVDEVHALAGNRRGTHLALSLERLQHLTGKPLQRIGLSATQKPIERVAEFLIGRDLGVEGDRRARQPLASEQLCESANGSERVAPTVLGGEPAPPESIAIVETAQRRDFDLAIELVGAPLEAVMSREVWDDVYKRLAELIQEHRTTLIFVNTRRLAERVTHHLGQLVGADQITSHHGSLSAKLRLDAENRLKQGKLRALVATSSLELGIDIGSVNLVCQLASTRSISTLLQRIGRAEHKRGGKPKGRIFPLSRDELVEAVTLVKVIHAGELDAVEIPEKPLDILSQQIVAAVATQDWTEDELFALVKRAWPYRNLTRDEWDSVVRMLAHGFTTKKGRRGALIHYDAINQRLRARRGARLIALTSGGAIPDNSDFRVVLDATETFIGTVNEDFAVESLTGDIFQLGNASWKIIRIGAGTVRVEDAHGQPPGIPFWLGEAPARTHELSEAVSSLRAQIEAQLPRGAERVIEWLAAEQGIPTAAARQLVAYYETVKLCLGVIPTKETIVLERFFDDSGGMQMVLHAPFGSRINRAWGLALRKRFCRKFNFELQAAATEDAVVLSLGTQHSFPLEEVFQYLHPDTVRDVLVQALLDSPMFTVRWRWNASRSLALPRQRGSRRIPAPLQRMDAENLLASVFPDQLACLENIAGDREIPDHPLVRQTIDDCLHEAMDIEGLIEILRNIKSGAIRCLAKDLPEPSPLSQEILNARPYAFLDDAPLEERRTRAVYTRRTLEFSSMSELGRLDPAAIEKVRNESWPTAENRDELHEALLQLGTMSEDEAARVTADVARSRGLLSELAAERRAVSLPTKKGNRWVAAERAQPLRQIYPDIPPTNLSSPVEALESSSETALRELVRGRLETAGPVREEALAELLQLDASEIHSALLALESEGFVLRGRFTDPQSESVEWCERSLLARIHRLTINRLRAEIQPVSIAEYSRFLFSWQKIDAENRSRGLAGLNEVLEILNGFELPAGAWEPDVLSARVEDYDPAWLDQVCLTGRWSWGRLRPPERSNGAPNEPVVLKHSAPPFATGPIRSSPSSFFRRDQMLNWLALAPVVAPDHLAAETKTILDLLVRNGPMFFADLVARSGVLPSRVEQGLGELATLGMVTSDSFEGLRALLTPENKKSARTSSRNRRRKRPTANIELAGRWSLLRPPSDQAKSSAPASTVSPQSAEKDLEVFARALLRRYGIIFRRLLDREAFKVSWYELGRFLRRLEARGEIRGGHFVSGISGEQFALPEAIPALRESRRQPAKNEWICLSAADPLNLTGILFTQAKVPVMRRNRILFRDGFPVAALVSEEILVLEAGATLTPEIERALKTGRLPPGLRRYYA